MWTYYESNSGYGTGSPALSVLISAVSSAFGGASGVGGESGLIYDGVESAFGVFGLAGNQGDDVPAAYLNYILFDQQFNALDMGWQPVTSSSYFNKAKLQFDPIAIKEAGYIFVYLSYENESNNFVYFDDLKVTHTKSNIIQYNEYYPFGMQTANSWTRENSSNSFMYNAGSEHNSNNQWYEMHYRGYDPALGRMLQVDPYASSFSSLTPYNFANNDPVYFNDPSGGYTAVTIESIIYMLLNSRYGGTWSASGGYHEFSSYGEGAQWVLDNWDSGLGIGSYSGLESNAYGSIKSQRFISPATTSYKEKTYTASWVHWKYKWRTRKRNGSNVHFRYLGLGDGTASEQSESGTYTHISGGSEYDPFGALDDSDDFGMPADARTPRGDNQGASDRTENGPSYRDVNRLFRKQFRRTYKREIKELDKTVSGQTAQIRADELIKLFDENSEKPTLTSKDDKYSLQLVYFALSMPIGPYHSALPGKLYNDYNPLSHEETFVNPGMMHMTILRVASRPVITPNGNYAYFGFRLIDNGN